MSSATGLATTNKCPETTQSSPLRRQAADRPPPSEMIIPAVPGEFYAYPSNFTIEKPLYALMKCKSNKARMIAEAGRLGHEASLLFRFDTATHAQVCAIKTARAYGLLGAIDGEPFGETWIKPVAMSTEEFYDLCVQENTALLVEICKEACSQRETVADLKKGMVIATMTDAGKYGLFLVMELTPESIGIDACHILLL